MSVSSWFACCLNCLFIDGPVRRASEPMVGAFVLGLLGRVKVWQYVATLASSGAVEAIVYVLRVYATLDSDDPKIGLFAPTK